MFSVGKGMTRRADIVCLVEFKTNRSVALDAGPNNSAAGTGARHSH
jgi:hypothetical protein